MTTQKEYDDRLLLLADFLDKLPPERFNYAAWVGHDWKEMEDLSCGTTACALGWAATMPEFRKLGLRLSRARAMQIMFGCDEAPRGLMVNESSGWPILEHNPALREEDVIKELFGRGAVDLFFPAYHEKNASPAYVAAKIRSYVAKQYGSSW